MNPDSACKNDVCCLGEEACLLATLGGLKSINCTGSDTCYQAVVSLSRDIVCTSASTNFNADACTLAEFTLTEGGDHVVKCLGEGVCYQAKFDFAANSMISFECDSNINPAACFETNVTLRGGSCLFLQCQDRVAWILHKFRLWIQPVSEKLGSYMRLGDLSGRYWFVGLLY